MSSDTAPPHWEAVYRAKADSELSWHQEEPACSRELIGEYASAGAALIDVGGGSSLLAGRLAEDGLSVTVLDISASAIERARRRNVEASGQITWLVGDVTKLDEVGRFDVWHDRAVFHFLTDAKDRRAYVRLLERSVRGGGHVVLATFATDGPPQCSGLPVERYDAATLLATLGSRFTLVRSFQHTHTTPWGKPQSFTWAVFQVATPSAP